MSNSPLHPFLAALPKCEHHVHLEGTLSPAFEFELAKRNSITLPKMTPPSHLPNVFLTATYASPLWTTSCIIISLGWKSYSQHDFEELQWSISGTQQQMESSTLMYSSIPEAHTSRGVVTRLWLLVSKQHVREPERSLG